MIPGYQLKRVSGPDLEPVTLEEAKAQCRVELDFTDDDINLLRYIKAARELAEVNTKSTFCATQYRLSFSGFPEFEHGGFDSGRIILPRGPIIELLSFTYLDSTRTPVTVDLDDATTLQQGLDDEPPWIAPAAGAFWPNGFRTQGAVSIEYLAGYASTAASPVTTDDIPAKAKQAMLMLVGHWYENREDVVAETRIVPTKIQRGFDELLDSVKVYP
jgi:uncharacterized phiE125 gp8 family phage protein